MVRCHEPSRCYMHAVLVSLLRVTWCSCPESCRRAAHLTAACHAALHCSSLRFTLLISLLRETTAGSRMDEHEQKMQAVLDSRPCLTEGRVAW